MYVGLVSCVQVKQVQGGTLYEEGRNRQRMPYRGGLFNLLRARPFVNARVNRCASLMLLVYLIHENLMLRAYIRPAVWDWVWATYGYSMLFGWIALFTVVLFVGALVCAFLYRGTLGKLVERLEPWVERLVRKVCSFVLDWICALT